MATKHRTIKAVLYPNQLKNNVGTFKAQTIPYQTLGIKDVCNSFCNKPGTGVDTDAMEYYVKLFLEEMGELLSDGFAINTGYFTASATIKGSFKNKNDNFEPDRHGVIYKFTQSAIMRKKAAETQAEILHIIGNHSGIQDVIDNYTGSENDLLTPGNNLHIKGIKLKLTGTHPNVGLYFINETTGECTKVPTCDIVINQNNRLIVMIPNLQPDSYCLEHITQYAGKGTPLLVPRSSIFVRILHVT